MARPAIWTAIPAAISFRGNSFIRTPPVSSKTATSWWPNGCPSGASRCSRKCGAKLQGKTRGRDRVLPWSDRALSGVPARDRSDSRGNSIRRRYPSDPVAATGPGDQPSADVVRQVRGAEPDRLVQGSGHDGGRLQSARGGAADRDVRLHRQHL